MFTGSNLHHRHKRKSMVQWVISILPGTPITNQRCIRLQGEVGLYPAMDDFLWTSIRPSLRLDCASSASLCSLLERPTWHPILQLVPESVPISFCCPIFPDSLSFLSSGYYYSRFKLDSDHVKPAPSTPVEDAFATVLILAQSYGIGVSCGGLSTVSFFF